MQSNINPQGERTLLAIYFLLGTIDLSLESTVESPNASGSRVFHIDDARITVSRDHGGERLHVLGISFLEVL